MELKRYQVFVSSTYRDLTDERRIVMDALINLECFPAGMELFPASSDSVFEYIKKIIDISDIYIIIVSGKYGSLADDGISYTEKEYDYAVSKRKPVLSFVKDVLDDIPVGKAEIDPDLRSKLEAFRRKIMNGRLCKTWNTSSALAAAVTHSLINQMKDPSLPGWVKGDKAISPEMFNEISILREENKQLKQKITDITYLNNPTIDIKFLDDFVEIHFRCKVKRGDIQQFSETYKWSDILWIVGRSLLGNGGAGDLYECFQQIYERKNNIEYSVFTLLKSSEDLMVLCFLSGGLIKLKHDRDKDGNFLEYMELTEVGRDVLMQMVRDRYGGS